MKNIEKSIKKAIHGYTSPVFFTSNHISKLSGIPSFSEKICQCNLNEVLDIKFLNSNPTLFFKIIEKFFQRTKIKPNSLHKLLAKLNIPIITENIDCLHQKAGSTNIIELYGNLESIICTKCDYREDTDNFYKNFNLNRMNCPHCLNILQPNIVLSGQHVNNFHRALNIIYESDAFIILGNKPLYYPCTNLIAKAKLANCNINYIPVF